MPEIVVSYKPAILPSKFSSRQSVVKLILLFCNNFSSLHVNHRKSARHRPRVVVKPNFFFQCGQVTSNPVISSYVLDECLMI